MWTWLQLSPCSESATTVFEVMLFGGGALLCLHDWWRNVVASKRIERFRSTMGRELEERLIAQSATREG